MLLYPNEVLFCSFCFLFSIGPACCVASKGCRDERGVFLTRKTRALWGSATCCDQVKINLSNFKFDIIIPNNSPIQRSSINIIANKCANAVEMSEAFFKETRAFWGSDTCCDQVKINFVKNKSDQALQILSVASIHAFPNGSRARVPNVYIYIYIYIYIINVIYIIYNYVIIACKIQAHVWIELLKLFSKTSRAIIINFRLWPLF